MTGYSDLGLDTLAAHGGEKVTHWSGDLNSFFGGAAAGFMSCVARSAGNLPVEATHRVPQPVSWVSAKNKFFTQILLHDDPQDVACDLHVVRDTNSTALVVGQVSASLLFAAQTVPPGASVTRTVSYYAGPKQYDILKTLGNSQDSVMEFGWFAWLCKPLLWTLNALYRAIPSYGIAIILLTVIVRMIFWPVTHKTNESMRKMQKVQPLVAKLREKFKDNPQRMNQEVMLLYREHKINPMAGCLPMLIQIPVFIALFNVLRSAIELRYAKFLWIRDLSEPERLFEFGFALPLLGWDAFNPLPLAMTATMVWQQKITPSTGDPQQQRMMTIMSALMLVFFYTMPSALVLYWTTSQCISIWQLILQRRRIAAEEAARA
jgi:YidC/Oxa1 family membrane protein insertase